MRQMHRRYVNHREDWLNFISQYCGEPRFVDTNQVWEVRDGEHKLQVILDPTGLAFDPPDAGQSAELDRTRWAIIGYSLVHGHLELVG